MQSVVLQGGNVPAELIISNGMDGSNEYTNREKMMKNIKNTEKTPWSSGLCACCGDNCGTCCFACFCSPFQLGFTLQNLGIVSSSVCPIMTFTLFEWLSAGPLFLLSACILRTSLAEKLNRKENPCESCCIMCCCFPCGIAQIERDMHDNNYKFNPPDLSKNNPKSYSDACTVCFGGIPHDLVRHPRNSAMPMGTPFTKNSMFRYYTRIPSQ